MWIPQPAQLLHLAKVIYPYWLTRRMSDMTANVDTTTCTTPALGKGHLSLLVDQANVRYDSQCGYHNLHNSCAWQRSFIHTDINRAKVHTIVACRPCHAVCSMPAMPHVIRCGRLKPPAAVIHHGF